MAHNGDQYDFPLLKAELKKIGTSLPSDTLCADSYPGLKEIFRERERMKPSPGEYYETNTDSVKVKGVAEMSGIQNLKTNLDEEYKELEVQNQEPQQRILTNTKKNIVTNDVIQAMAEAGVLVHRLANGCNLCEE